MHAAPAHAWQVWHPPLQAHADGLLDVGDGHRLHWEQCGHPGAPAVLFLHGGPGAGCTPDDRRWFDPARWRIVLVDQRGCGRSTPAGGLHANTTAHLLRDIEVLRTHLGIAQWRLVFGGSWGATLALCYAQQHRPRVAALVLRGVFMATAAARDGLYGPAAAAAAGATPSSAGTWSALAAAAVPGRPLLDGLAAALEDGDSARRAVAARAWWQWEQSLMVHEEAREEAHEEVHEDAVAPASAAALLRSPGAVPPPQALLAQARIGVHYARHGWFLREAQLVAEASALRDLPGCIVQGARDRVTPAQAVQALLQAWPTARLRLVGGAGHAGSHPVMAQALVHAVDAVLAPPHPVHPA